MTRPGLGSGPSENTMSSLLPWPSRIMGWDPSFAIAFKRCAVLWVEYWDEVSTLSQSICHAQIVQNAIYMQSYQAAYENPVNILKQISCLQQISNYINLIPRNIQIYQSSSPNIQKYQAASPEYPTVSAGFLQISNCISRLPPSSQTYQKTFSKYTNISICFTKISKHISLPPRISKHISLLPQNIKT